MNIVSGRQQRALKAVLYGPEGIGKTTLAARFPNPLFIDTEGGSSHLDVRRVDPAPDSWQMLLRYVREVAADPSLCSTLVLDTADWAEAMCVSHVCMERDMKSIEDAGYGKGYTYLREEFGRLLDMLSDLVDRGVNVLVCAHAQIRKFEQPDELGAYDRWELKLSRQCSPLLKEWADLLLFANYKTVVVQPDRREGGRAKAQGGRRVMYASHTPAWDAKNRLGLPDEMPLDFSAIASVVPDMRATAKKPAELPGSPEYDEWLRRVEEAEASATVNPQAAGTVPDAAPDRPNLSRLRSLMSADGVDDAALQSYCAGKGYCPEATPVDVYPEDFAGFLVAGWDAIAQELGVPF